MKPALIILFLFCSNIAIACDCPVFPLSYRIQESDAIFLGKIISHENNAVELHVLETFKGNLNTQISIPASTSMCDYFLPGVGQPGSRFLIFMHLKNGKPSVSRCFDSAPESEALEEIKQLRSTVQK
jgi:hypothetical protein